MNRQNRRELPPQDYYRGLVHGALATVAGLMALAMLVIVMALTR